MKNLLGKKFLSMIVAISTIFFLIPNIAFGVGWDYNLDSYEHWGSSPCTTGYPNMVFTINQSGGESFIRVEKYSGGSWKSVSGNVDYSIWGAEKIDIKVPVSSSSTQYRAFVHTGTFGWNTVGTVSCKGSW
jgi:hypothetical protein